MAAAQGVGQQSFSIQAVGIPAVSVRTALSGCLVEIKVMRLLAWNFGEKVFSMLCTIKLASCRAEQLTQPRLCSLNTGSFAGCSCENALMTFIFTHCQTG